MLEVQSLNVGYGARLVLRDISFNVGKGEIVALIGPNGTGKTTLMRASQRGLKAALWPLARLWSGSDTNFCCAES